MKICCLLGLAVAVNLPSHSLAGGADSKTEQAKDSFRLELRQRTGSSNGLTRVVRTNDTFDPRTTAVVVIDMCDRPSEKMDLTLALTLALSPREREWQSAILVFQRSLCPSPLVGGLFEARTNGMTAR